MRKSGSLAKDTRSNFGLTHWLVILLLMAFGYFANGSMNDGLNTYVGLFTGRYGWTSAQLLTYSTYAGWASILVIIAYTQFARRRGARMTAIVAMTVAAAGMFLWARVTTQAMYFVGPASGLLLQRDHGHPGYHAEQLVSHQKGPGPGVGYHGPADRHRHHPAAH